MGEGAVIKIVGKYNTVYLTKRVDGHDIEIVTRQLSEAYNHLKNLESKYAGGAHNYADIFAFTVVSQYRETHATDHSMAEWYGYPIQWVDMEPAYMYPEYDWHLVSGFDDTTLPSWYKQYRVNLITGKVVYANGKSRVL